MMSTESICTNPWPRLAAMFSLAVIGGALTSSCTRADDGPAPPSSNATSISGTVGVAGQSATGAGPNVAASSGTPLVSVRPVSNAAASHRSSSQAISGDFVPGEIIVKFRSSARAKAMTRIETRVKTGAFDLKRTKSPALPATAVYRADGASPAQTLELVHQLEKRPDVLYAQPNYRMYPMLEPNDQFYPQQWHYPAIKLPVAWNRTTGSSDTVVAVVDSGILFHSTNTALRHPDFTGKVVPGFDFISDPQVALDGDGRDSNPFDEGTPGEQSSYHGSHVAGTIAAATNDGNGVAGVNWAARMVPVRALGNNGGSLVDVIEGMMWAAGIPISGVPNNANPADVINMSLGGKGACSPFAQQGINEAIERGAIIVVAAGNDNLDTSQFTPASCTGVITVGATDLRDKRAPYSNFGLRIDVMAPGGDLTIDRDNDGFNDGVLSVGRDDTRQEFDQFFLQGTSMATPHVAGVVSLMKAVEPVGSPLTAAQALTILRNTARPLSAAACNRSLASDCGAGLIDAAAAVEAIATGQIPGSDIAFSPDPVDMGSDRNDVAITLSNLTDTDMTWQLKEFRQSEANPVTAPNGVLSIPTGSDSSGIIPANGTATTRIALDRSFTTELGTYAFELLFTIDAVETPLLLRFSNLPADFGLPGGPMIVAALIETGLEEYEISGSQTSTEFLSSFSFEVDPGQNWVVAWSDDNENNEIDAGDFIGAYSDVLSVTAGQKLDSVNFDIGRVLDNESVETTWYRAIESIGLEKSQRAVSEAGR
ncbi:MAG: S8 family peptidase [Proteobacteria bacterium]|nr:S8 family peptidase [Pseudomonadota bacterium]